MYVHLCKSLFNTNLVTTLLPYAFKSLCAYVFRCVCLSVCLFTGETPCDNVAHDALNWTSLDSHPHPPADLLWMSLTGGLVVGVFQHSTPVILGDNGTANRAIISSNNNAFQ